MINAENKSGYPPVLKCVIYCPLYAPELDLMHASQDYKQDVTTLPKTGYIVFQEVTPRSKSVPIAAGFLRLVEGGYAQFDSLISNKAVGSYTRHLAMTMLVDQLIYKAKELKIKGIISYTRDEGIIMRAEALGFQIVHQTILSLSLGD